MRIDRLIQSEVPEWNRVPALAAMAKATITTILGELKRAALAAEEKSPGIVREDLTIAWRSSKEISADLGIPQVLVIDAARTWGIPLPIGDRPSVSEEDAAVDPDCPPSARRFYGFRDTVTFLDWLPNPNPMGYVYLDEIGDIRSHIGPHITLPRGTPHFSCINDRDAVQATYILLRINPTARVIPAIPPWKRSSNL